MTIGEQLYQSRRKRGWTLQQAADHLGIHKSTLFRYEQDEIFCSSEEIRQAICREYGISLGSHGCKEERKNNSPTAVPMESSPVHSSVKEYDESGKMVFMEDEEFWRRYQNSDLRTKLRIQFLVRNE
ncbi:MAG: helix-turn-helix transcriptional regulator [Clostridiales bacterium]|nr:helix-turn-helix transcriptional regulator [Clostridiales bacterium]